MKQVILKILPTGAHEVVWEGDSQEEATVWLSKNDAGAGDYFLIDAFKANFPTYIANLVKVHLNALQETTNSSIQENLPPNP